MTDTYLVTGAMGCIGAWTLYYLHQQGKQAVAFDIVEDRHRLDLLLTKEEQADIPYAQGDIRDFDQVKAAFEQHGITHVIHLAALQVPACRANPVMGAQVNVVGTVNIFEAAVQTGLKHVAYASSVAVYGPPELYPPGVLTDDAPMLPRTLYGVYKVNNEDVAGIYYQDHGLSSAVLRPYTVYGLGRDQGITSEPTKAMLAAARGEDYHITFGGEMQFHYAPDMARQFILCAEQPLDGAHGFNLGTTPASVGDVVKIINDTTGINGTWDEKPLPFPVGADDVALKATYDTIYQTPIEQGVKETIAAFKARVDDGRIE